MTAKKLYLVVTPFFPTPNAFYGPFIYDQVKAIERLRDYRVVVFKPILWRDRTSTDYEYDGVKVYCYRNLSLPSYLFEGLMDGINGRSFIRKLRSLGIDPADVAAIHCHTCQMLPAAIALKKLNPDVVTIGQYHDLDPCDVLNGRLANWKLNLNFRARHSVRRIESLDWNVAISRLSRDNLLSFPRASEAEHYKPYLDRLKQVSAPTPRIDASRCIVMHNGVDLNKFKRIDVQKSGDKFTIGCIGNYLPLKRHYHLVDAVRHLSDDPAMPPLCLRLVGNNPPEGFADIQRYVHDAGMDDIVEFVPPCDHRELYRFYNTLDLFVLPSVFEGFGCVFTEAWACGVPFISCENQGIGDIISDEERHLWLAHEDDPSDLAAKIRYYIQNRPEQHLTESVDINILCENFLRSTGL